MDQNQNSFVLGGGGGVKFYNIFFDKTFSNLSGVRKLKIVYFRSFEKLSNVSLGPYWVWDLRFEIRDLRFEIRDSRLEMDQDQELDNNENKPKMELEN